ncbi:MAG: hypothetical protein AAFQ07_06230, partial [Chloroflexota bacterium]
TIQPVEDRYPNLQAWLDKSHEHLQVVYRVAEASKLDTATREQITLTLDGREWSMELVLSSLKFHLETEFPSLMQTRMEHNLTTLYALHMDDKYRLSKLAQSEQLPEVLRPTMQKFADHFSAIPPSTDP